ncbi:unnamed protein product [Caenorhabditis bovis]|uniref:Uncharacterized protein n=1 Tax=Caenorhabditis bovis TaxID=2654633 RepID=A0A8S1FF34_9PELO|nr:unnamed protein product [Caenorhabditis bovis]
MDLHCHEFRRTVYEVIDDYAQQFNRIIETAEQRGIANQIQGFTIGYNLTVLILESLVNDCFNGLCNHVLAAIYALQLDRIVFDAALVVENHVLNVAPAA